MVVYYYCIFPTYNLYASCQSQIRCRDLYALHTPHAAVLMPSTGGNNAGKWAESLQECKTPPSMYAPQALLPSSTGTGEEAGHRRLRRRRRRRRATLLVATSVLGAPPHVLELLPVDGCTDGGSGPVVDTTTGADCTTRAGCTTRVHSTTRELLESLGSREGA